MKKKVFAVLVSVVLVLSVVLLVAYAKNQPGKENVNLNQAQASAPSVKNSEVLSVSPDEAIGAALKHAGVSRDNAVMFGVPSLDKDNGKVHYDVEFGYNGFEYDYEVAVPDGSILKAEKEAERVKVSEKESVPAKPEVPVSKENKSNNNNNGYISVESAKQKALDDAGVKAEDAVFLKTLERSCVPPDFKDVWIFRKDIDDSEITLPDGEAVSFKWVTIDEAKRLIADFDDGMQRMIKKYEKLINLKTLN